MTGSTEGGTPETGDRIDESAVTPSLKAHTPPLQPDRLWMQVDVRTDGVSVEGEMRVHRGVHAAAGFAVVSAVAAAIAVVVFALCCWRRAGGPLTLGASAAGFLLVLVLGLAYISYRSDRG